jgi:hypothetical protein
MNKTFQYFFLFILLSLLFFSLFFTVFFDFFLVYDVISVTNVDFISYTDLSDVCFRSDLPDLSDRNGSSYSSDRSSTSSSFNHYSCSNFFGNYKEASTKVLNNIKHEIKDNSKLAIHKFKVYKRTFAWFFKGSRPGGGRGL